MTDANPATEIDPLDTMSPKMLRVPPEAVVIALPGIPPHPAWLRAATVGVYSRLLTPEEAVAASCGEVPPVRMRANWSTSARAPLIVNWTPAGPRAATTWVSTVPSEYVHVIVRGAAPGDP